MRSITQTGILCVPDWDDAAIAQVGILLRTYLPGAAVVEQACAQDQQNWVEETLRRWCDEEELDLIITIGGTLPAPGTSGKEIVPHATLAILDTVLPGIPETMRAVAAEYTHLALLDRSVAGIRSRSLVLNLPAGAAAAHLFFEAVAPILEPALAHLRGDETAPKIDQELELSDAEEAAQSHEAGSSRTDAAEAPLSPEKLDPAEFAAFLQKQASEKPFGPS